MFNFSIHKFQTPRGRKFQKNTAANHGEDAVIRSQIQPMGTPDLEKWSHLDKFFKIL